MMKQTHLLLLSLAAILLVQSGCGTLRMSQEPTGGAAAVDQLVKATQSWDGERLPRYPEGQPEVTILRITIPAGARLDTHSHPVINAGVLISGELTVVTSDGKTLELKAGDPIVEVVNTLHYGINQGTSPAEIIVFYAGIVDTPVTVVEPQREPET